MPRVVGIDPGTVSFGILGLQDGDAFLERSVPISEVARRPETLGVLQAALARGTVLDQPYLTGAPEVRRWALGPARC
jgi:predicted butyrate kinase (DUF1464 family)